MEQSIFDQIEILQKYHWYHVGTKEFIQDYISANVDLKSTENWLDVGCGGGGMITAPRIVPQQLRVGIDVSDLAPSHWKGDFAALRADAQQLPFTDGCFDLVTAFDIIEHLENDQLGVSEIYRVLAPGGSFVMIVPCHSALWSSVDVELGHQRRYDPREIVTLVKQQFGGVEPLHVRYLNNVLFFPAYLLRAVQRAGFLKEADKSIGSASMPPPWLNSMLLHLFQAELRYASAKAPVGIGTFLHIRKPRAHPDADAAHTGGKRSLE